MSWSTWIPIEYQADLENVEVFTGKTLTVVQRHIRKNENKKTYKSLTYEYVEDYIMTHGSAKTVKANLKEFYKKRLI